MPTAFEVVSEPHRRQILDLLLERPRPVGERLVRARPDAQRRLYELRPAPLAEIDAWLQPYRRLWADRLDELERHLDRPQDGQRERSARP